MAVVLRGASLFFGRAMSEFRITGPGVYRTRGGWEEQVYDRNDKHDIPWIGSNGLKWRDNGGFGFDKSNTPADLVAFLRQLDFMVRAPGIYLTRDGREAEVVEWFSDDPPLWKGHMVGRGKTLKWKPTGRRRGRDIGDNPIDLVAFLRHAEPAATTAN